MGYVSHPIIKRDRGILGDSCVIEITNVKKEDLRSNFALGSPDRLVRKQVRTSGKYPADGMHLCTTDNLVDGQTMKKYNFIQLKPRSLVCEFRKAIYTTDTVGSFYIIFLYYYDANFPLRI